MHGLVTDESFELAKTNEYILSIQVSLDGFSFSVNHPDEKRLLALKHTSLTISNERFITRRLTEWMELEELLQKSYREIRLIVASEKFILVPDSLYNAQYKRTITQPVLETDATEEIRENFIDTLNMRLLFTLPPQLRNILNDARIIHPVKMFIEKRPAVSARNGLILWFNSGGCYLVLYNAEQIILANHFRITHENDVIYYVLTTLKQLGVSSKETQLFVAGEMAEKESMQNMFQKYFVSVDLLHPEDELQLDNEKFSGPLHPFVHLYL